MSDLPASGRRTAEKQRSGGGRWTEEAKRARWTPAEWTPASSSADPFLPAAEAPVAAWWWKPEWLCRS